MASEAKGFPTELQIGFQRRDSLGFRVQFAVVAHRVDGRNKQILTVRGRKEGAMAHSLTHIAVGREPAGVGRSSVGSMYRIIPIFGRASVQSEIQTSPDTQKDERKGWGAERFGAEIYTTKVGALPGGRMAPRRSNQCTMKAGVFTRVSVCSASHITIPSRGAPQGGLGKIRNRNRTVKK